MIIKVRVKDNKLELINELETRSTEPSIIEQWGAEYIQLLTRAYVSTT